MSRFVVQEHHARHLHWDFRLEKDGVLKSWAVPKGVPEKKLIKRLAIQVEDHDLDYIDFEGEIEEGEYGAGTVTIWDKGSYELEAESAKTIVFDLKGDRLSGKYSLVHLKDKQWLLIKI
ncbi:MAG TPA: 3'-phosphoesterase [Nitrospiraceae bacterium]|nr:3'-phosphoesterase [Nitrospiraceae bacterium]